MAHLPPPWARQGANAFYLFLLILTLSLVILLWTVGIFGQMQSSVGGGVDFLAYYAGGYLLRYVDGHQMYDLDLQQRVQKEALEKYRVSAPGLYPYNHPPVYLPILYLAATADYNPFYLRWLAVLLSFHVASLAIFARLLRRFAWKTQHIRWAVVAGLLFYPLHISYLKGQDSAILLFALTAWAYGLLTESDHYTAFGLGLSMVRPQIGFALLLPTLVYKPRLSRALVLWGLGFFVINFPWIGTQGVLDFLQVLFRSGQGYGFDVDIMATLMGAILRGFPAIDVTLFHAIGYSVYFAVVLLLALLWRRQTKVSGALIGFSLVIVMLVSPHTHNHDYSLLLIPAVLLAVERYPRQGEGGAFQASMFPLLVALGTIAHALTQNTFFIYLTLLGLALPLWRRMISPDIQPQIVLPE